MATIACLARPFVAGVRRCSVHALRVRSAASPRHTARAFSMEMPNFSEEELPSNLKFNNLKSLTEPAEYDEKLLLRADTSEKVLPVMFLTTDEKSDDAKVSETVVLDNRVFGVPIRRDIAQRVVVWQRARWRLGTAHTKTRADVRGGGAKPWKQKGTGRARAGSRNSPLWRGGGKAHGKKKRDFSFKLNKKVRQMGLRVVLAAKYREGNLFVVNVDGITSHKTADFVAAMDEYDIDEEDGSTLLIDSNEVNPELKLASQNLHWMSYYPSKGANVYNILLHHRLFVTPAALEELTGRLAAP